MMERRQHMDPWADKLQEVQLPDVNDSWKAMAVILDREMPVTRQQTRRRWLLLILLLLLLIGVCNCPRLGHRYQNAGTGPVAPGVSSRDSTATTVTTTPSTTSTATIAPEAATPGAIRAGSPATGTPASAATGTPATASRDLKPAGATPATLTPAGSPAASPSLAGSISAISIPTSSTYDRPASPRPQEHKGFSGRSANSGPKRSRVTGNTRSGGADNESSGNASNTPSGNTGSNMTAPSGFKAAKPTGTMPAGSTAQLPPDLTVKKTTDPGAKKPPDQTAKKITDQAAKKSGPATGKKPADTVAKKSAEQPDKKKADKEKPTEEDDVKGLVAGIGLNQFFSVGQQQKSDYNSGGTSGGIGDYIPVPMVRYYFSRKLFVQLEAQFNTPQYTKKDLVGGLSKADTLSPGRVEQNSVIIKKLFYFNLPLSLHYSPFKNLYLGAGLQYSRLSNGVGVLQNRVIMTGATDSIKSAVVYNIKGDSVYQKMRTNEFRVLFDINYTYKKFILGVRYNQALSKFLDVRISDTKVTQARNSSLQLYARYILWDHRKKRTSPSK